MGVCVGDLDSRQVERLRGEVAWLLVEQCATPPFFDFRAGRQRNRPPSRETIEEVRQFVSSANLSSLERADVSSPELRRFLERLFTRYLEVNPRLRQPHIVRRVPEMRVRVPWLAAETQRGLLAFVGGAAPDFGTRRQRVSWLASGKQRLPSQDEVAHRTRLIEAGLVRTAHEARAALAMSPARPREALYERSGVLADTTVPVQASGWPAAGASSPASSPFGAFRTDKRSAAQGSSPRVTELPTGPLASPGRRPAAGGSASPQGGGVYAASPARVSAPPEELYEMYGDYLRDMQADAGLPSTYQRAQRGAPVTRGGAVNGAVPPAYLHSPAPTSRQSETDQHLFWQLRYQVEAYVRRAARSYGVQARADDPFAVLDALRRSAFVDEADLRIAEGILALTDRVTAGGSATVDDYRQAMTLYLLYHRSHLGD